MSVEFERVLSAVRQQHEDLERTAQSLVFQRESAVKFIYELRGLIEGNQKRGVSSDETLTSVLEKLKNATPHGRDNQVS